MSWSDHREIGTRFQTGLPPSLASPGSESHQHCRMLDYRAPLRSLDMQAISAKYDELVDQTEQQVRQRAAAKRVNDVFGHEERARRRDGLKELESPLYTKNQELVTAQSLLLRERTVVKRLERSLECQICPGEPWDTANVCGIYSAPSASNCG